MDQSFQTAKSRISQLQKTVVVFCNISLLIHRLSLFWGSLMLCSPAVSNKFAEPHTKVPNRGCTSGSRSREGRKQFSKNAHTSFDRLELAYAISALSVSEL